MNFGLVSLLTLAFWVALTGNFGGLRSMLFGNSVLRPLLLTPTLLLFNLYACGLASISEMPTTQTTVNSSASPSVASTSNSTTAPTPTSGPAATATPALTLSENIETLWAKSDWVGLDILLQPLRNKPEWSDELNGKLYAANINEAQRRFQAGDYAGAGTYYRSAKMVDPNRGEAELGLQQVTQKQKEAARAQARANAKLEVLSWGCTKGHYGYSYICSR